MKFTFVESVGKQKLLRNEKTVDFIDDTGVEDQVINIYPQIKYRPLKGLVEQLLMLQVMYFNK